MKRILAILITALFLSGCKKAALAGETERQAEEKGTVMLVIWDEEEEQDQIRQLAESFASAHSETSFVFHTASESLATVRDTVLTAPETAADVFAFSSAQLQDFAEAGVLLPLNEDADEMLEKIGQPKLSEADASAFAAVHDRRYAFMTSKPVQSGEGTVLYGVNLASANRDWAIVLAGYIAENIK